MVDFLNRHSIVIFAVVAPFLLFPLLLLLLRYFLRARLRARRVTTLLFIPLYLLLWVAWGAVVVVRGILVKNFEGESPTSTIIGIDHIETWDIKEVQGNTYALVHVWTTYPDYMQRFDLYKFPGSKKEINRSDCKSNYRISSENLEGNIKEGIVDLFKSIVVIFYSDGKYKVFPFKE